MKLLVAFDGSDAAENALAYASDVADPVEDSITIVHAVHPNVYEASGGGPVSSPAEAAGRLVVESVEEAGERGQEILDEGVRLSRDLGHEADAELLYGPPAQAVTDYAQTAEVDTIVVGHRGLTGRADVLLGSVAKQVVERASVPVTVVR